MSDHDRYERFRQHVLEIVENQLRDGTPPETTATYRRLVADGHSAMEAKRLIGVVIAVEMNDMMQSRERFNLERFIRHLNNLPAVPV